MVEVKSRLAIPFLLYHVSVCIGSFFILVPATQVDNRVIIYL